MTTFPSHIVALAEKAGGVPFAFRETPASIVIVMMDGRKMIFYRTQSINDPPVQTLHRNVSSDPPPPPPVETLHGNVSHGNVSHGNVSNASSPPVQTEHVPSPKSKKGRKSNG